MPRRLDGRLADPFSDAAARAVVLVFIGADCPISNRYVPEMLRLQKRFRAAGVTVWFVYPEAGLSPDAVRRHATAYGLGEEVVRDPAQVLVRRAGATITPEAVVYGPTGRMVYRGRIDNRHEDLSHQRPAATERDLELVLEALVEGREPAFSERPAVGCYIDPIR